MKEEKIIVGQGGPYPLNGVLTLPDDTETLAPAAVLVHGSGSTDMDEKIMANRPFRDLAESLAARGVAVIRYDKRSFKYGRALVKDTGFTVFDETIEDALLASALLRKDPRIDPDQIFIIGHSMGGMLAPRIDAEGGGFAGLVIMAGTPRKLEEVLTEQFDSIIDSGKGLNRAIVKMINKRFQRKLAGLYEMSDDEAKKIKVMGGARAYYFKEMGLHDSPSYLAKTKKPILVLQGGKDFQVSVSDFEKYKELLDGRDNTSFRLYPNLNHLFMPSVYGELKMMNKEYKIPSHVDKCVAEDIAAWIKTGALAV